MHYHAEIHVPELSDVKAQIDEILAPYSEHLEVEEYSNGEVSEKDILDFVSFYVERYPDEKFDSFEELYAEHGYDWNGDVWKKTKESKKIHPTNCGHCSQKVFETDRECPKCGAPIVLIETEEVWEEFFTYNPKSFYDWYQIGGRWTGVHTKDYNPSEDPKNWKNGELKWPTDWVKFEKDIIPVQNILEDLDCQTLIVGGEVFDIDVQPDFDGNVKKKLFELGVVTGYMVTVDYHI